MSDHGEGRPLVLVADDDQDVLELVAFRLERDGYEVIKTRDGEEALAAARERPPALAVLDVMMPKLNGFELTQALRGDESTREVPVILLTASVQEADVQKGFDAGANDYLRKPFSSAVLREMVEKLVRRPRAVSPGR
jgi:DNA-binding response OmpR family regulator